MSARLLWGVVLVACSAPAAAPPVVPVPVRVAPVAIDPAPPTLRLPAGVVPLRNAVDLTLAPDREDFAGEIAIDVMVQAPTAVFWLNASEIEVARAEVVVGSEHLRATPLPAVKDYLGLRIDRAISGPAKLVIAYRGVQRHNDGDGIFSVDEDGARYVFTQFGHTDARQAFPCFDEPSFKTPWQLTLHVPRALVALGNTQIVLEREEPGDLKAVRFAETRPLPSYLVAFAVGPFEMVDAGTSRGAAPIRIVVPRGHRDDALYAAQTVRPVLDILEDYFGSPYPYDKLDLLAVPVFNLEAMENPGLVTFLQSLMLFRPGERTPSSEQQFAALAAHELAHQWFGDVVTMAWWDDTWLNEAFATWLGQKTLARWKPSWNLAVDAVSSRDDALRADSIESARAIRQPIASAHDIANAFDDITYEKGGAVLAMLEQWLGADVFRAGVRDYLAKHAWGNATYADFVAAMSAAAKLDVRPVFDTFIVESGAPLVAAELDCHGAPTVKLAQHRYAPLGSRIDARRDWHLPVCVRWGEGAATGQQCTMLAAATGELVLNAKTCPSWVVPNAGSVGYYRSLPVGELRAKLLARAASLDLADRVGLIGDVRALVASGDVPASAALELVGRLAHDDDEYVIDAAVDVVAGVENKVPAALHARYERLIDRLYGAPARALGWQPRAGENANTRNQRVSLLGLVAVVGRDAQLGRQASALIGRWLGDHRVVDRDLLGMALDVAARRGGPALFGKLHGELVRTTDRRERTLVFAALGAFVQPRLAEQARALILVPELDARETMEILWRQLREPRTREAAYAFVTAHFDELAARLPARSRTQLTEAFEALCDDRRRAEIEAFFGPRVAALDGGPRVMQQALESMALCAAQRKAETPSIVAFLQRQ